MRRKERFVVLVLMLFVTINQAFASNYKDVPVEVKEVKEVGLSDSDETKAVIEIQWSVKSALQPNHAVFNVTLEVIYADGAILLFDQQAQNQVRSTRIEVPALHIYRGKKPAIIKQIKAFVTTEILD